MTLTVTAPDPKKDFDPESPDTYRRYEYTREQAVLVKETLLCAEVESATGRVLRGPGAAGVFAATTLAATGHLYVLVRFLPEAPPLTAGEQTALVTAIDAHGIAEAATAAAQATERTAADTDLHAGAKAAMTRLDAIIANGSTFTATQVRDSVVDLGRVQRRLLRYLVAVGV